MDDCDLPGHLCALRGGAKGGTRGGVRSQSHLAPHAPGRARLESDAGELPPNGYRLTVAGPCDVTSHRWITPQEAAEDLAVLARRN